MFELSTFMKYLHFFLPIFLKIELIVYSSVSKLTYVVCSKINDNKSFLKITIYSPISKLFPRKWFLLDIITLTYLMLAFFPTSSNSVNDGFLIISMLTKRWCTSRFSLALGIKKLTRVHVL